MNVISVGGLKPSAWLGPYAATKAGLHALTKVMAQEWAPLRDGQADVEEYFRALHAAGYDGWVTCEDFSTAVPLARRTSDNLAYLQDVEKRTRP